MDWVLIGIPAVTLGASLFALALLRASRALRRVDEETRALAKLGSVKSPNGTPFFPHGDAVWELAGSLEDPELRRAARRGG